MIVWHGKYYMLNLNIFIFSDGINFVIYSPPGTYGSTTGLTTSKCTASCPVGTYSKVSGLMLARGCITCPANYYGWQCNNDAMFAVGS